MTSRGFAWQGCKPNVGAPRGVATWPETVMKAHAFDQIANLIERHLCPGSGITRDDVISEIVGIVETKTGRQFPQAGNQPGKTIGKPD